METPNLPAIRALRPAWNKGRIVGQKRPLKPKHVWAIRVRLELAENHCDLALFNMAIDSKFRGCDLMKMKVVEVMASGQIKERASVLQSKTQKPKRFEISEGTRASIEKWMEDELMIETDSPATIRAYEAKLETLEAERARKTETLGKSGAIPKSFERSFRTAMTFLANPRKLWLSPNPEDQRTVLKLVFAAPLPYARNQGFRTAKTTSPFKALGDIEQGEIEMAERQSERSLKSWV